MSHIVIVPGRYENREFIPDGKLPDSWQSEDIAIWCRNCGPDPSGTPGVGRAVIR